MKYYSIIPFGHSISTTPLIYSCSEEFSIGSLVEIEYGKQLDSGIVVKGYDICPISEGSEYYNRIKGITKSITQKPLLAAYQLEMIEVIAKKYMIPLHRVLQIFLHTPLVRRLEKKGYENLDFSIQIRNSETIGNIYIFGDTIVKQEHMEEFITEKTAIILPDDFALIPYKKIHANNEKYLFLSHDMTDTRRSQAWIDISNGLFERIYGTRKLLYYNLQHYKNILYIEDSFGPEYWHYPVRIDYLDILRILHSSTKHTHTLQILTSIPSLATLTYFRHFGIKNITTSIH